MAYVKLIFVFSLAAFFMLELVPFAYSGAGNYAQSSANSTLANATYFVEQVNESAYLIFYPNLTQAYYYLNKSSAALNSSPDTSVAYANLAVSSAKSQYALIGKYRTVSAAVMALITAFFAMMLFLVMKGKSGKTTSRR